MSSARRLNLNMKEEEVTRDIMVVIANFPGKAYQVIHEGCAWEKQVCFLKLKDKYIELFKSIYFFIHSLIQQLKIQIWFNLSYKFHFNIKCLLFHVSYTPMHYEEVNHDFWGTIQNMPKENPFLIFRTTNKI